MVTESSLTTFCERPYCKAACTMYLCIFGGFSKFFSREVGLYGRAVGVAEYLPGARVPLTSCLWALSCWWMPFAEPELPVACKSRGQDAEQGSPGSISWLVH